jgi:hypothetical protein
LLFLLENGSAPIISLPQFSKSFWTSEFIVFEMNSRLSSAHRPGTISVNTNTCKNRAAEKILFTNYSILFLLRPSRLKGDRPAKKGRMKSTLSFNGAIHMPAEVLKI